MITNNVIIPKVGDNIISFTPKADQAQRKGEIAELNKLNSSATGPVLKNEIKIEVYTTDARLVSGTVNLAGPDGQKLKNFLETALKDPTKTLVYDPKKSALEIVSKDSVKEATANMPFIDQKLMKTLQEGINTNNKLNKFEKQVTSNTPKTTFDGKFTGSETNKLSRENPAIVRSDATNIYIKPSVSYGSEVTSLQKDARSVLFNMSKKEDFKPQEMFTAKADATKVALPRTADLQIPEERASVKVDGTPVSFTKAQIALLTENKEIASRLIGVMKAAKANPEGAKIFAEKLHVNHEDHYHENTAIKNILVAGSIEGAENYLHHAFHHSESAVLQGLPSVLKLASVGVTVGHLKHSISEAMKDASPEAIAAAAFQLIEIGSKASSNPIGMGVGVVAGLAAEVCMEMLDAKRSAEADKLKKEIEMQLSCLKAATGHK